MSSVNKTRVSAARGNNTQDIHPGDKRTFWIRTAVFALTSPLTALPALYLLMCFVGDVAFGGSQESLGLGSAALVALKRTLVTAFISIVYIVEHFLTFGALLLAVSGIFAVWAGRLRTLSNRIALAFCVSGALYPALFGLAELLDWDAGMFN